jgi:hypothetical protein
VFLDTSLYHVLFCFGAQKSKIWPFRSGTPNVLPSASPLLSYFNLCIYFPHLSKTCTGTGPFYYYQSRLFFSYFKIPYQFNEEKTTAGLWSRFLSLLYKNIPNQLLSFLSFLIVSWEFLESSYTPTADKPVRHMARASLFKKYNICSGLESVFCCFPLTKMWLVFC